MCGSADAARLAGGHRGGRRGLPRPRPRPPGQRAAHMTTTPRGQGAAPCIALCGPVPIPACPKNTKPPTSGPQRGPRDTRTLPHVQPPQRTHRTTPQTPPDRTTPPGTYPPDTALPCYPHPTRYLAHETTPDAHGQQHHRLTQAQQSIPTNSAANNGHTDRNTTRTQRTNRTETCATR